MLDEYSFQIKMYKCQVISKKTNFAYTFVNNQIRNSLYSDTWIFLGILLDRSDHQFIIL